MFSVWKLKTQLILKTCQSSSVMPPGIASYPSPKTTETFMSETQKSAGTFSLLCFRSLKKARRGVLYRKSMAIGMRSTVASVDGAMRVFFKHSMNIFMMLATSQVSSLIPRLCAHMPRQQGLRKKRTRGTSTRTNSRRIYDETESVS